MTLTKPSIAVAFAFTSPLSLKSIGEDIATFLSARAKGKQLD